LVEQPGQPNNSHYFGSSDIGMGNPWLSAIVLRMRLATGLLSESLTLRAGLRVASRIYNPLSQDLDNTVEVEALLDTGSTVSFARIECLGLLNAPKTGVCETGLSTIGMSGQTPDRYAVEIRFPSCDLKPVIWPVLGVTIGEGLPDLILGLDFLRNVHLSISASSDSWEMTADLARWELIAS
jgi:hypothetical protein